MSVVQLDADAHIEMQSLMPWYLNGTLDDDETSRLEQHVAQCPRCRAALDAERELQAAVARFDGPRVDVERGLAAMRRTLHTGTGVRRASGWPVWGRWLLGGQFAAIAVLAGWLLLATGLPGRSAVAQGDDARTPGAAYRTLGARTDPAAAAAAADAIAMFAPEATEQQIREALRSAGATLAGGPTVTNAYLLRLTSDDHARSLARLRALPVVTMVESLEAPGPAR